MEIPELKVVVASALAQTYEHLNLVASLATAQSKLGEKVYAIKEEIDTSPDAESAKSLLESISNDTNGISTQYHLLAGHLEEIQSILQSF